MYFIVDELLQGGRFFQVGGQHSGAKCQVGNGIVGVVARGSVFAINIVRSQRVIRVLSIDVVMDLSAQPGPYSKRVYRGVVCVIGVNMYYVVNFVGDVNCTFLRLGMTWVSTAVF